MNEIERAHLGEALGTDFFSVREQFTHEQWEKFSTARKFVDSEVIPVAADYWEHAGSLRAIWQADITLDRVRVPGANRLPGARSFSDTVRVLAYTRTTCAWPASRSSSSGWSPCWPT